MTALDHVSTAIVDSFDSSFPEPAAGASQGLYNASSLRSLMMVVHNDIGVPGAMRAPGEASGSAALECAIDEMAEKAGMDPLEFRLKNYADVEPGTASPIPPRRCANAMPRGPSASAGQAARSHPARWWMTRASSPAGAWARRSSARRCLQPRPVRCCGPTGRAGRNGGGRHGAGGWTALAQIAADSLGLPLDKVEFRSGSSDLPDGGVAGGSGHTATAGGALHAAGTDAIRRLGELAAADPQSPLFGTGNQGFTARDGRLYAARDESRSEAYADIIARAGGAEVEGKGSAARPPEDAQRHAMYSHGAVFAEVKIDPVLFQMRVTRLVGAFAAGRIINPKLAESQLMGGMIWGISFALHEEARFDSAPAAS